jgi:hypothetical protein
MIAFKDALAVSDRQFAVASAHHKMDIHRSLEVFADVFGDFARLFAEELVIRNGKYSNLLALLRSIGMEFSESRKMEIKCPSPSFLDQRRRSILLLTCIAQQVSHIASAKPRETLDIDIILLIDRALVRVKTSTQYYCCEISDECADKRLESLFGPIEYLNETEAGMLMDSGLKLMQSIDDVIDVFASLEPNVVDFSDVESRIRATAKRCFRAYTAVKAKYMLTL